jgi:regulator of RNase E activity RraA
MKSPPPRNVLESLRRFDTCAVANAIETFDVRLRNEGFTNPGIHCLFPDLAPIVAYAVTVKIRCSAPPLSTQTYKERTDWWNYILKIPAPRVVVVEDVDPQPGTGAMIGEIHANILHALGCVGAITNGVVRDLPAIRKIGFQLFAASCGVSHAFAHIVEIGHPVTVAGLKIQPGDLLHGDMHGVLSVPLELAEKLPEAIAKNAAREHEIISACRSDDFSIEKLRTVVKGMPWRDGHPN